MSLQISPVSTFPLDIVNPLKERTDKQTAAYANAVVAYRAELTMQFPYLLAYFFLRDINVLIHI